MNKFFWGIAKSKFEKIFFEKYTEMKPVEGSIPICYLYQSDELYCNIYPIGIMTKKLPYKIITGKDITFQNVVPVCLP